MKLVAELVALKWKLKATEQKLSSQKSELERCKKHLDDVEEVLNIPSGLRDDRWSSYNQTWHAALMKGLDEYVKDNGGLSDG